MRAVRDVKFEFYGDKLLKKEFVTYLILLIYIYILLMVAPLSPRMTQLGECEVASFDKFCTEPLLLKNLTPSRTKCAIYLCRALKKVEKN